MPTNDFLSSFSGSTDVLSSAGSILTGAGMIMQGGGYQTHGQFAAMAAEWQAQQLRQNAKDTFAASQRSAYDASRQGQYIASKMQAISAAGGGGATDPGVVSAMARVANETAYRTATAIYGGESRARLMNMQASAADLTAQEELRMGNMAGITSELAGGLGITRGASSLLMKFGNGGPSSLDTAGTFTR